MLWFCELIKKDIIIFLSKNDQEGMEHLMQWSRKIADGRERCIGDGLEFFIGLKENCSVFISFSHLWKSHELKLYLFLRLKIYFYECGDRD